MAPLTVLNAVATSALTSEANRLAKAAAKQVQFEARRLLVPWRFLAVASILVLAALIPIDITPHDARDIAAAGLMLFFLAGLTTVISSKQVFAILNMAGEPLVDVNVTFTLFGRRLTIEVKYGQLRLAQAVSVIVVLLLLRGLQRLGSVLIAASFFIFWALVTMLVWCIAPHPCLLDLSRSCSDAYRGMGTRPRIGLFLYYSVFAAVANNPPSLIANSALAQAALVAEALATLGVLGTAARFVGWPERHLPGQPGSTDHDANPSLPVRTAEAPGAAGS